MPSTKYVWTDRLNGTVYEAQYKNRGIWIYSQKGLKKLNQAYLNYI